MTDIQKPLPSPGVGARRKGPKSIPKLDFSAFTPTSATSDKFPLPPSPSALHPERVLDAQVVDLEAWKAESAKAFGNKTEGVVVAAKGDIADVQKVIDGLRSNSSKTPIIAVSVPFPLENGPPSRPPQFSSSSSPRILLSTTVTKSSESHAQGIAWALDQGYVVDVNCDVGEGEADLEALEDVVDKASGSPEDRKGKVVLSNILPPPHPLSLPIVKLLTHPTYLAYQKHIASLSLFSNVYIKFHAPAWGSPTPETEANNFSKDAKEWKRRIKMYLGPAVEAFGYQRILFGSSPSPAVNATSNASDWYELARESIAELGLEQEDIDAVFCNNAKTVYGS